MSIPVDEFDKLHSALSNSPEVEVVRPLNIAMLRQASAEFDLAAYAQIFEEVHGTPCPKSLQNLLALPQSLSLVWRSAKGGGELGILEPSGGVEAKIDASYVAEGMAKLNRMSILDQITEIAGPLFILFDVTTVDEEGLFLFDGHNVAPIGLSPDEYLNMAALCGCFDSWQFIFSKLPVTLDRLDAMQRSFQFVKSVLPDRNYTAIESGFAALSTT